MASQAWIAERAVPLLKDKPQMRAKELKEELEKKYKINIIYHTCWYGRQRAADKLFVSRTIHLIGYSDSKQR